MPTGSGSSSSSSSSFTAVYGQGATLGFNGSIGHITDVDVSRSASPIDSSGLDLNEGDPRSYEPPSLIDGGEFKVEALYSSAETSYPKVGDTGAVTLSIGSASFTGDAVVSAVSVKYAVGEVVKLSLTFKVGGTLD